MHKQDIIPVNGVSEKVDDSKMSSLLREKRIEKLFDAVMEKHRGDFLVGITFANSALGAYYRNVTEYMHFKRILKLGPEDVVLDLGCGIGRWAIQFASRCKYVTAVDISQKAIDAGIEEAKRRCLGNIKFVKSSLADYSENIKYDLIFIGGVLIYINDSRLSELSENILRMLKPGGRIVLRETVSLQDAPFCINRYHQEYGEYYEGYYRTPEMLLAFFSKDFRLIYRRDTYVDMFAVKIIERIIPRSLQNNIVIRFFCRAVICAQVIIDPFLLESKWLIRRKNKHLRSSDDPASQYFFVLTKNSSNGTSEH